MRKLKCLGEENRFSICSLCGRPLRNGVKSELETSQRSAGEVALETDVTGVEHVKEPGQSISCPSK